MRCSSFLLPFFFIETKSWQKPKSWQTSQFHCKQRIPPTKILPIILQKILQKNPHKKFPTNSQTIPKKNSPSKNLENFHTSSQKIPKILKISNSLHRTWRPKTLSGLFLPKILSISFVECLIVTHWQNVIFSSRSYLKNFHLQRLWKEFQRKFTFVQTGNWWKRSYSQILPPSTE